MALQVSISPTPASACNRADNGFCVALKPILISEGIYRSYCTQKEIDTGVRICVGQELRLNLLFTISAVAANVMFRRNFQGKLTG